MPTNQLSAEQLIQYLSWVFYLLVFAVVLTKAIRRPTRANIDILLFFTLSTLAILSTVLTSLGILQPSDLLTDLNTSFLIALAYALMRLSDDFWEVPGWLTHTSEVGIALIVVGNFLFTFFPPQPRWFQVLEVIYLVVFFTYSSYTFVQASRSTSGVTRRRMRAVAIGSGSLVLGFLMIVIGAWLVPSASRLTQVTYDILGLVSGIAYFLGFATPTILRRAWQEPELRAFLGRAANLPRLPDTQAIVREMERGAASSIGAPQASIGLWDEGAGVLHFVMDDGAKLDVRPDVGAPAARAFSTQQPVFSDNTLAEQPQNAAEIQRYNATAILAAPITAGKKRLGVLTVYAPRAPIFADEDLNLLELLAQQFAVILESRALIDDAARVRAREEVARMKEDFLSAAAHDLKTPLTTLVAQTQLLERRALRAPGEPVDLVSVQKLVRETERLRALVMELLDASRAEQGRLVGEREEMDLVEAARETCGHHESDRHTCIIDAQGPVTGVYDRNRILQLLENLVENAVKYSPVGGSIRIRLWKDGDWNYLTVSDQGIGIPPADMPYVFERFHRGTNVDDRRFAGMGLGLYICRGIVEQHGGHIRVAGNPGRGTTFEVALPAAVPATLPALASRPGTIGEKRV